MIDERTIPLSTIATVLLWAGALATLTGAWLVCASSGSHMAVMLGFTSCALAAMAATVTIRGYTVKVCSLIRITAGLERPRDAEVTVYPVR